MQRTAVYAGSFDPFTRGHEEIVRRSLTLFDKVVIAIGQHPDKVGGLPVAGRRALIEKVFEGVAGVCVVSYEGLTVDLCRKLGAGFLVRGLRNGSDYVHEYELALSNTEISGVETVFLPSSPGNSHVSSTLVRELMKYDPSRAETFAPSGIRYADYY